MAGIDKIYGSVKEFVIFWKWAEENNKELLDYFYGTVNEDGMVDDGGELKDPKFSYRDLPITNFPQHLDKWLWWKK